VGFEAVREAFAEAGPGCAVAAWHDGHWVVDLSTFEAGQIVQPYSVTKPFAAITALILVDRGLLDLDAPVQWYWPEFTAPATVRQVLSHQAGVVVLDEPEGGYAYAFTTSVMGTHDRSDRVENALRDCLGLPPMVP
jgi:CubicO group peptidase (beta-lactamase class C family)